MQRLGLDLGCGPRAHFMLISEDSFLCGRVGGLQELVCLGGALLHVPEEWRVAVRGMGQCHEGLLYLGGIAVDRWG